jgi:ethanolamine ammonia-lyase small subunit
MKDWISHKLVRNEEEKKCLNVGTRKVINNERVGMMDQIEEILEGTTKLSVKVFQWRMYY